MYHFVKINRNKKSDRMICQMILTHNVHLVCTADNKCRKKRRKGVLKLEKKGWKVLKGFKISHPLLSLAFSRVRIINCLTSRELEFSRKYAKKLLNVIFRFEITNENAKGVMSIVKGED